MNPKVSVVILNFNGKKHLQQFLPFVVQSDYDKLQIVVIDNASTDGSVAFLVDNYAQNIEIICLKQNFGYAEGYNQGLKHVESDYYILLNSDVEVPKNWIRPMLNFMDENPAMAACQPKILAFDRKNRFEYAGASGGMIDFLGYPFCRGRIFDHIEQDLGQYDDKTSVFWASGACLLLKSDVFWSVGAFDGDYFAHMEEIDLCWRLQLAGFLVGICPQVAVFHVGGGTLDYNNPRKTYLNFRNSLFTLQKNLILWQAILFIAIRLCFDYVSILKFLATGQFKISKAIVKAHLSFLKHQPQTIEKRSKVQNKKSIFMLRGVYKKSIVLSSFLLKKYFFSMLTFK